MGDERVRAYAKLLVDRCVGVQPGWQVSITTQSFESRPLVEAVIEEIALKGAYALPRIASGWAGVVWAKNAPDEVLSQFNDITRYESEKVDAMIIISDHENTSDGSDLPPEKMALYVKGRMPAMQRRLSLEVPWVGCQYPTNALAQDARMTLRQFEDFLYGACLLDWDAEEKKMRRLADRFDAAKEVRIVGEGTDLTIGIDGRTAMVDDGHLNMPGGEFFFSPLEGATEGEVTFSEFPAVYQGNEVRGAWMRYEDGRIVDAKADVNEEYLVKVLDSDDGARVLGELGIGCNPGINKHMRNTLFDEKIYGTIHLAVGAGFPFIGGTNTSIVHWDMVKDLRQGGQIFCDGELVQSSGEWQF